MIIKHRLLNLLFFLLLSLMACQRLKQPTASQQLQSLIKHYEAHEAFDKEKYPLGLFTKAHYQAEAAFAQAKLDSLALLPVAELSQAERVSLALLQFILKDQVVYYEYERYLNPLLSDAGFHASLNYEVRPITNYHQAKTYLNKLNTLPTFVDQHLTNLREGIAKGRTQPRVIFKGYESTYDDHIVAHYEDSYFYSPFKKLPNDLSEIQKDSFLQAAQLAVETKVIPQFKRIKNFFETEYLPQARTTLGLSDLPKGKTYYQDRINYYTTSTEYTAEEIHILGRQEVKRIRAEMQAIIEELNFKGDFAAFLQYLRTDPQFYAQSPEDLLMFARDIAKRVDAQLPRFFQTLPRKPYGVAPVPDAIAPKYTAGRYIGTEKESTEPGYYWVNTYDLPSRPLYTLPALTVHEAVPGHHLQISLNNEMEAEIPDFRKNLYLSAYGEGWALYCEFLAEEMGIYRTPYERFGRLTYEMWRACRLVVDTGIHAKGWSREQVIAFMSANTALSIHEINTETDRYISWPGQALSYKIGELKIRALRDKAEAALGSQFDLRAFHEIVLEAGTVTLAILEASVDAYIAAQQASAS